MPASVGLVCLLAYADVWRLLKPCAAIEGFGAGAPASGGTLGIGTTIAGAASERARAVSRVRIGLKTGEIGFTIRAVLLVARFTSAGGIVVITGKVHRAEHVACLCGSTPLVADWVAGEGNGIVCNRAEARICHAATCAASAVATSAVTASTAAASTAAASTVAASTVATSAVASAGAAAITVTVAGAAHRRRDADTENQSA